MDFLRDLADIFTVGKVLYGLASIAGVAMFSRLIRLFTLDKRRQEEIRVLEERVNRTEWDWADLKRLHPELVKDFPPRD